LHGTESRARNKGKGVFSLAARAITQQRILCLALCASAAWLCGCDTPVCTGQDLQGAVYGQPWALRSGMAVRGRYGYVMILSSGEPAGNPCSFAAYAAGGPSLQITVPAFPGDHPLNDPLDRTQVSFCAADALVCDIAASGEVRIDRADLRRGTLSGSIEAYLDDTTFVSGCFAIRRCTVPEWLRAERGAE
jgi:hypothetical protein